MKKGVSTRVLFSLICQIVALLDLRVAYDEDGTPVIAVKERHSE